MINYSCLLLAGGKGSRMKAPMPKQFLPLNGKIMALWSYEELLFCKQVIVVADPLYRHHFKGAIFAEPGERRQDSLFNGLEKCTEDWVLIHDAARPYITRELIEKVMKGAIKTGAAALACPLKFTVKQADSSLIVLNTPDRSSLWEIQTPQVVKRSILQEGFKIAREKGLTVTDDVSLAELAGYKVQLVESSYSNIKITTPDDLCKITK